MHRVAGDLGVLMSDDQTAFLLARHFPDWEIIRDRDGWHAIPSARVIFREYLHGREVPDLHAATAPQLLILLEAWRDSAGR